MRVLKYKYDKECTDMEKAAKNENSDKITLDAFMRLVKDMRHYQRRYAATRNENVLAECKKLEAQVDTIISEKYNMQKYFY